MKLVILTFVLILSFPCLAAAFDTNDASPAAPQSIASPPRITYGPVESADRIVAAPARTLISPYSVIRYDRPAQPVKPAPAATPDRELELPQFAPYRSTSRLRPTYLP